MSRSSVSLVRPVESRGGGTRCVFMGHRFVLLAQAVPRRADVTDQMADTAARVHWCQAAWAGNQRVLSGLDCHNRSLFKCRHRPAVEAPPALVYKLDAGVAQAMVGDARCGHG